MALGGKVYDAVNFIFGHHLPHLVEVGDVTFDENIIRRPLDVGEVGKVAGVCELVEVHHTAVGIFVDEQADHMRADESGPARNHYVALKVHNQTET